MNTATGRTLRYGVIIGLLILAAGMLTMSVSEDTGMGILKMGIAVIIFTPMVSIVVSAVALYMERDYRWFGWVSILLAITLAGLAVSYYF